MPINHNTTTPPEVTFLNNTDFSFFCYSLVAGYHYNLVSMLQPKALQGTSGVKATEKGRAGPILTVGEYPVMLHRKGKVSSECPVPLIYS